MPKLALALPFILLAGCTAATSGAAPTTTATIATTSTTTAPTTATSTRPRLTTTTATTKPEGGFEWTKENLALHVFDTRPHAVGLCMADYVFIYAKSKNAWDRIAPSERDYVLLKAMKKCDPKYGGSPK